MIFLWYGISIASIQIINMASSLLALFSDKCRICLDKIGVKSIFEDSNLTSDIEECTGIEIMNSKGLPETVCSECLVKIDLAKALRLLAKKSDDKLREVIGDEDIEQSIESMLEVIINDGESTSTNVESKLQKKKRGRKRKNIDESKEKKLEDKPAELQEQVTEVTTTKISVRSDLFESSHKPKVRQKNISESEEDYICQTCDKKFPNKKCLYHHSRMHTKPFSCPVCSKPFSSKNDVNKHVRIHTGERPFQCDVCNKTFTQNVTLKMHKQKLHRADEEIT